ncbi:hypothetical protein [Kordia sp.]|uniref:tetratricopeptide repeat protein n=1 Tax=Kordia sp. TaxID=1965332 RepID=UPI003D27BD1F
MATDSDGNGTFILSFKDELKAGDEIFMQKITKKGYELVNRTQLQILKLSSTDSFPEKIILAKHGMIDSIRAVWSGASINALTKSYRRENQKLKDDLKNSKISKKELDDALVQLSEQYEQEQKKVETMADRFARTNFDDVDPIYKKALQKFKEGKIDSTIILLESINVIDRIRVGISEKKKAEKYIEDNLKIARTQGDMYSANFEREKAIKLYDDLYKVDSTNLDILSGASNFFIDQKLHLRAIKFLKYILSTNNLSQTSRAVILSLLGEQYYEIGLLSLAKEKFNASLSNFIFLSKQYKNSDIFIKTIASINRFLGNIELDQGNLKISEEFFLKSIDIENYRMIFFPNNHNIKNGLALSYESIGDISSIKGEIGKAEKYYRIGNELILELNKLVPNNLVYMNNSANFYAKLGILEFKTGNLKTAKMYFMYHRKLMSDLHDLYPNSFLFEKNLSLSYQYLAKVNFQKGEMDIALENASNYLEIKKKLIKKSPDNTESKHNLALASVLLGDIYESMGMISPAKKHYLLYNKLEGELHNNFSEIINYKYNFADSYRKLALFENEDIKKKRNYQEKYFRMIKELYENHSDVVEYVDGFARANGILGDMKFQQDNLEEAYIYTKQYNDLSKELVGKFPLNPEYKRAWALSNYIMGSIELEQEHILSSFEYYKQSNEIIKILSQNFPQNKDYKDLLSLTYHGLGDIEFQKKNSSRAVYYYEKAKNINEELFSLNSNIVSYTKSLSNSYSKMARAYLDINKIDKALESIRISQGLKERLYTDYPNNYNYKLSLAKVYNVRGNLEVEKGNLNEAQFFFEQYNLLTKELYEVHPQKALIRKDLITSFENLGFIKESKGNKLEALNFYKKGYEYSREDVKEVISQKITIKYYYIAIQLTISNKDRETLNKLISDLEKEYFNYIKSPMSLYIEISKKLKSNEELYLLFSVIYKTKGKKNYSLQNIENIRYNTIVYAILSSQFKEAEQILKEALALNINYQYLHRNLPVTILMQGNRFEEAKQLYLKWKNKPYQDAFFKTYKGAFLSDFVTFEKTGIIPDAVKQDVEKIKALLNE